MDLLDGVNYYQGESERWLGEWMQARGNLLGFVCAN